MWRQEDSGWQQLLLLLPRTAAPAAAVLGRACMVAPKHVASQHHLEVTDWTARRSPMVFTCVLPLMPPVLLPGMLVCLPPPAADDAAQWSQTNDASGASSTATADKASVMSLYPRCQTGIGWHGLVGCSFRCRTDPWRYVGPCKRWQLPLTQANPCACELHSCIL